MHTPAKVLPVPALSQHTQTHSDNYELDAAKRAAAHQEFWSGEPLTEWQEFLLCRELDCSRRPYFSRGPRPRKVQDVLHPEVLA